MLSFLSRIFSPSVDKASTPQAGTGEPPEPDPAVLRKKIEEFEQAHRKFPDDPQVFFGDLAAKYNQLHPGTKVRYAFGFEDMFAQAEANTRELDAGPMHFITFLAGNRWNTWKIQRSEKGLLLIGMDRQGRPLSQPTLQPFPQPMGMPGTGAPPQTSSGTPTKEM